MKTPDSRRIESHYRDGTFCSAGVNHFVIAPNGDVYRCMTELVANSQPLFHIRDGWKKEKQLYKCPHGLCQIACDVSWASKWIFNGKHQLTTLLPRVLQNGLGLSPTTSLHSILQFVSFKAAPVSWQLFSC